MRKLLSYHAVSQAGYMVLGIGTGNPIGIAGGLFHMLNNTIYKYGLFLSAGAVEHRAKTTNLDKLGGLARVMPITFVTCVIAALSISGIPPFNGFVSKWMIYQGVIETGAGQGWGAKLWIVWLIAAMFGSALTLASFMKLIHCTFLGARSPNVEKAGLMNQTPTKRGEVPWTMWLPMGVLAGLCVIFGVFAFQVPLRYFIFPSISNQLINQSTNKLFLGFWSPGLATLLIIVGLIIGAIIYWLGNLRKSLREDSPYIGGEVLPSETRVSGVDFYGTIKDLRGLKGIYERAEKKFFDIYNQGGKLTFFFTHRLQRFHGGILPTYLVWCLAGMLILFFVLMR
jgi:formate hydrogenlyase subunit 3/multisubunit Na+/H+ antiporter MnhD subunit